MHLIRTLRNKKDVVLADILSTNKVQLICKNCPSHSANTTVLTTAAYDLVAAALNADASTVPAVT